MAEELFDVVDEHDRVIDVQPRSEVHRRKLRHRAVHVFLFRSDGRMLIHLRSADKEEFPSVWTSSASGHVSSGEDYADSAVRELREELGIVAPLTRLARFNACPDTSLEFTELFRADSDADVVFDPIEITKVKWLLPKEIRQQISADPNQFSPAFRLLFRSLDL
ncbi:MAG: NUDIX domain-containing protein [Planctomycetaceae bacterium]